MAQKKQSIPQQSSFDMTKPIEKVEKALHESEDKFKYFFDHSPIGKSITLPAGEIQVNFAFCKMLGYSEEKLRKKKWQDITHPDDFELTQREVDALLSGKKESARFTKRYLKKDGTILWADVSTAIRRDASGKPMYFITSVIDITERKGAEDALKESGSLYQKMIENSPLGMHFYELDNNDQLVFVGANPAANKLLGVDHSQFVGKTIEEAFPSLVQTEVPARYRDAAAKGMHWSIEQIAYEDKQIMGAFDVRAFQTMPGKMVAVFANIAERKRAEEALRESETRFRTLFEHAPVGVALTETETGQYLDMNLRFCDFLGYTLEEIKKMSFQDVSFPEELPENLDRAQALMEGKIREFSLEKRYVCKDGTIKWGFLTASALWGKDDSPAQHTHIAVVQDISERKKSEEAIRESELKFRQTFEISPVGIVLVGLDKRFIDCNAAFSHFLGYEKEVLIGRTINDVTYPEDNQIGMAEMLSIMKGELFKSRVEKRYLQKDGQIAWGEVTISLVKDSHGQPQYFLAMVQDITNRKWVEKLQNTLYRIAQSADQAQSLNSLFPAIHNIIQEVMPAENFYIALNDEKNDLISYPYVVGEEAIEEQPGMPVKGLTEYVLRTAKPALVDEALEKDLQQCGEVELVGVPSPIWLGVPLITTGKAIGVMVVQDYKNPLAYGDREMKILEFVSSQVAQAIERKRSDEEIHQLNASLEQRVEERTRELRETQEKLIRQEKLAVLGQLASGVGHELRNPLGVINNSIYYLNLIQPNVNDKIKQYHTMIEQEAHNAEKIITDLLGFARATTADKNPVSIALIVENVLMRFHAPSTVKVALEIPPSLPVLFVDPHQIEQVLGNLVVNAYQAMDAQKAGSTSSRSEGNKLTISAKLKKDMVEIAVKDTGVGISPENMNRLFEPLYTTKLKGVGLGLAVSKKLVEANSGKIEAVSVLGKGSTFTVRLPVYNNDY